MASVKVIPAEPILFHPAALDEYLNELSTEAQHVLVTRLKAHLSAIPFGRNGQNVEKCAEGLLAGGNGLPAISVLRKQAKRYDLRAYFIIEGGSATLLYIESAQRRDKRTGGATQALVQRRREVVGRTVRLKPLSAATMPRTPARESILAAVPDEQLAPLASLSPEVAASLVRDAPPPIESRRAPTTAAVPAPTTTKPAEPVTYNETVRRVLHEFQDDPNGLTIAEIAALAGLPEKRAKETLRALYRRHCAATVPDTRPGRWTLGPAGSEPITVSYKKKGYVDEVLAGVRTYMQEHGGQGPTAAELYELLTTRGATAMTYTSLTTSVHTLHTAKRLARFKDGDKYRYSIVNQELQDAQDGETLPPEGAKLPPEGASQELPPSRLVRMSDGSVVVSQKRPQPAAVPIPSSPPALSPQPRKGAREQLLDFADGFRACVGNALASDELTEDECSGALAVLKVIKEYTAKLREAK